MKKATNISGDVCVEQRDSVGTRRFRHFAALAMFSLASSMYAGCGDDDTQPTVDAAVDSGRGGGSSGVGGASGKGGAVANDAGPDGQLGSGGTQTLPDSGAGGTTASGGATGTGGSDSGTGTGGAGTGGSGTGGADSGAGTGGTLIEAGAGGTDAGPHEAGTGGAGTGGAGTGGAGTGGADSGAGIGGADSGAPDAGPDANGQDGSADAEDGDGATGPTTEELLAERGTLCTQCAQTNCLTSALNVLCESLPTDKASKCFAVLTCELGRAQSGTGTRSCAYENQNPPDCWCGQPVDPFYNCAANGPATGANGTPGVCVTQIRAAFPGLSDSAIMNAFNDTTYPGGAADNLVQCLATNCASKCLP